MPPGENALGPLGAEELPPDKKRQHLPGEDLGQPRVVDPRDLMEDARLVHAALGHQEMEVGVEVYPVPEGLDGRDDTGRKRAPGQAFEVTGQGPEGAAAEVPQKPARELKEDPQHLGDGEDDLAMRHVQKKRLPHPLAPLLKPLGMTGWAESPGAAGKHQEPLLGAGRTPDPGKPAFRIAAVEITLDHLLDDRPEKTVLPLETGLILSQEPVEMMEEYSVEDGPLRMSGTVDSRHGGRMTSRNGPKSRIRPRLPRKT